VWDTSLVHKKGIKPVSNPRLLRRSGVYYYRRRVPAHLVKRIGKSVVQVSLQTTTIKEAKRLRTLNDLEWDARFAAAEESLPEDEGECLGSGPVPPSPPVSESDLVQLVRDYVERQDERARKRHASCAPVTTGERSEMTTNAEFEAQTLRASDDPQAQQWIYHAGQELLKPAGRTFDDPDMPGEALAELVRRALLELSRRRLARLSDDHSRTFFDQLFDPRRPPHVTFGVRLTEEEVAVNGLTPKGLDRQRASLALIREIIGDRTSVEAIDYDACLRVRSVLARLPANRTKFYGDLPIEQAIQAAAKEGKSLLSPVTQQQYLAVLRDVLDLAEKKRLIAVNFAEGLKPIKRDAIAASDKRKPFTLQQIRDFFNGPFYTECALHKPPFAHDKAGWRFWLPLICLSGDAAERSRANASGRLEAHDSRHVAFGHRRHRRRGRRQRRAGSSQDPQNQH
jgi:hypothetical protein